MITYSDTAIIITRGLVCFFLCHNNRANRATSATVSGGVDATYFQTEDHKTKMPFSWNLKVGVTLYEGLQELCHFNPLKISE